ncbi:unnamed protein product [Meloidogyne enterolobii]|uniref:Uncharacterized protein n=1 Tax=Meloidogyne enterolobii TaxID=390850 RepID=A0ACB0YJR5_MELEN
MSQMLKRLQVVAFNMPKLDGRLILAHRCLSSIKFEPAGGANLLPAADPNEYGIILSVDLLSIYLCHFPPSPNFLLGVLDCQSFLPSKIHTMLQVILWNSARKKSCPFFTSRKKFVGEGNYIRTKISGDVPDSIEQAYGQEKKMIIARLMGDDRYEPKLFYRAENSTRDYPNLVPCHLNEKHMVCKCEPDASYLMEWIIRKDGKPHRCECGHWFKAVDAEPETV